MKTISRTVGVASRSLRMRVSRSSISLAMRSLPEVFFFKPLRSFSPLFLTCFSNFHLEIGMEFRQLPAQIFRLLEDLKSSLLETQKKLLLKEVTTLMKKSRFSFNFPSPQIYLQV